LSISSCFQSESETFHINIRDHWWILIGTQCFYSEHMLSNLGNAAKEQFCLQLDFVVCRGGMCPLNEPQVNLGTFFRYKTSLTRLASPFPSTFSRAVFSKVFSVPHPNVPNPKEHSGLFQRTSLHLKNRTSSYGRDGRTR
jgi:hypothetical protein